MGLTSIRKKLRGMKRRVRTLPLWSQLHRDLDFDELNEGGCCHLKMWISPFFRLYKVGEDGMSKKNPPHWFKKKILSELTTIYLNWKKQLEKQGEPYYLKLWLMDPNFMDTRIIAAKGEWIDYYENLPRKNSQPKPFPKEKFNINHPSFSLFQWKNYHDGFDIYENEIDSPKALEKIKSKSLSTEVFEIQGKKQKSYFVPDGDIWIGEIT